MKTVILLILSNVFMTFAWYGHLAKDQKSWPLWLAILASWGIAFFEYCLQVPANRWGHEQFTAPQLKIIQEAITLPVFAIFSTMYLKENLRWNDWVAFGLIFAAVLVAMIFKPAAAHADADAPVVLSAEAVTPPGTGST